MYGKDGPGVACASALHEQKDVPRVSDVDARGRASGMARDRIEIAAGAAIQAVWKRR